MRVVATVLGALVLVGALLIGPLGAVAAGPYVYGCSPTAHFTGTEVFSATLYNGNATTANVTMKLLAFDGTNRSSLLSSGSTFTVGATTTKWVNWVTVDSANPQTTNTQPVTARIVSDVPLGIAVFTNVSGHNDYSPCTYFHP